MNEIDKKSRSGVSLDTFIIETNKAQKFVGRAIPIAVVAVLLIFIAGTTIFIRQNSHFINDDIWHFDNFLKQSLLDFMLAPIDVHFVPLHKLASFLIFTISPLDFRIAIGFMVAGWITIIVLTYRVLIRLTSNQTAWIITLILGASPLWIHNLIWWSSAMHRLPYLLFQAAAFLAYLRYRERENGRDAFLCIVMQVFAFGFYIKAILYPLMLAAFEICLAVRDRHVSRAGIKLCGVMAAISMIYLVWYFVCAPVLRQSHEMHIFDTVSVVFLFILRLGSLLLFLPIEKSWSLWVSGAFWFGLAIFYIWRRPSNILPIAVLLVMLSISIVVDVIGRNHILLGLLLYPFGPMRYYLEQLVIIGIFAALVIGRHTAGKPPTSLDWRRYSVYAISLMFIVTYPMASYQTSRVLFAKIYGNYRQTHDFMVNLKQSLQELSNVKVRTAIAGTRFPDFVMNIWQPHIPIDEIFGPLYPKLKWVKSEEIRGRILYICDDGFIVPSDKYEQSPCAGQTKDTELFVHKSPDFTVTVPKDWTNSDVFSTPTVVLNKNLGWTKFIVAVEDLSKYPAGTTMKDAPKFSCLSFYKMSKGTVTNCQTLYEREIKLKDGTSAYEYEVKWGTPTHLFSPTIVFYTYRVIAVKDKKSIEVEVVHTGTPVSDELKQFPLSLTFK